MGYHGYEDMINSNPVHETMYGNFLLKYGENMLLLLKGFLLF